MKKLPRDFGTLQYRGNSGSNNFLQNGQALILLLLVLSVVLVVSLSITSRSITDIGTVTYEEEAQRAFSAAEAGIEEILNDPSLTTGGFIETFDNNASVNAVVPPPERSRNYVYPRELSSGESAPFWLVSRNSETGEFVCNASNPCFSGPHFDVCWGKVGTPQPPALLVSIYYDSGTGSEIGWATTQNNYKNVKVVRLQYDARYPARGGFVSGGGGGSIGGQQFLRCRNINVAMLPIGSCAPSGENCVLLVHTKMLYNDDSNPQPVGVRITTGAPSHVLPDQGLNIESTGTAGETKRRVEVVRTHPLAPSMFDSAVFSMTDIVKNP